MFLRYGFWLRYFRWSNTNIPTQRFFSVSIWGPFCVIHSGGRFPEVYVDSDLDLVDQGVIRNTIHCDG
jgi:hypothetical protein